MPDATTPEAATTGAKVRFIARQKPVMEAGAYTIKITQAVAAPAAEAPPPNQSFSAERRFRVQGPRSVFRPADIRAVFPADGSLADHSAALPHVVLDRGTLPWERTADRGGSSFPWLALLLFDGGEEPSPSVVEPSKLAAPGVRFPAPPGRSQDQDDDRVTVIDVPWGRLAQLLPTGAELAWLAHVRRPLDAAGHPAGADAAVIIGNRLPAAGGTSTAHLVSLEGRYVGGGFDAQGAGPGDLVRLVSLKSWSFACTAPDRDFAGLLSGVRRDPATLRLGRCGDPTADGYLALGAVALPHTLRRGGSTVSWYHGPLAPAAVADGLRAPVQAADELVRYNPHTGLFDVSYAAAWQLGRMLTLRSRAVATSLYVWKRASVQWLRAQEQRLLHPHIPRDRPPAAPTPPDVVVAWFNDLRALRGVPFEYLVPDERMLPVESLRFFRVDHLWVDCLLDGAYSIGRISAQERGREDKFAADPTASDAEAMSGFLLRSEVVAHWPGLLVDAFGADGGRSERVRLDRLAADVLIGVFRGEIGRVSFRLAPEGLHFGLDRDRDPPAGPGRAPTFHKTLRDSAGDKSANQRVGIVPFRTPAVAGPVGRVINVAALAQAMAGTLNVRADEFSAAHLAFQMIEGTPLVDFMRADPHAPTPG